MSSKHVHKYILKINKINKHRKIRSIAKKKKFHVLSVHLLHASIYVSKLEIHYSRI